MPWVGEDLEFQNNNKLWRDYNGFLHSAVLFWYTKIIRIIYAGVWNAFWIPLSRSLIDTKTNSVNKMRMKSSKLHSLHMYRQLTWSKAFRNVHLKNNSKKPKNTTSNNDPKELFNLSNHEHVPRGKNNESNICCSHSFLIVFLCLRAAFLSLSLLAPPSHTESF